MMADAQPGLQPASTASSQEAASVHDMNVEQVISDKLIKGYILCKSGCPMCATPLVKNQSETKSPKVSKVNSGRGSNGLFPILVPSESFEQPFIPVIGVPYCLVCQAHVVTSEEDVDALERSESFKDRGSILVALEEAEEHRDVVDKESFDEVADHERVSIFPPLHDDNSEDGTNSFTKSLSSIMKESESILGRPVDPNRFTTALFCGTTASRQLVSTSPVNSVTVDKDQVSDPYNDIDDQCEEYDDKPFADALEEELEDSEEPEHGRCSPLENGHTHTDLENRAGGPNEEESEDYEESPKNSEEEEDPEAMMVEYNVRREIASRLLATKLLEGYTLRDAQCNICSMPMMEYNGDLSCVVCPALMEKAKSTKKTMPLSPVERKAKSIERRWATEATHVAEEEEMRKAEQRRQLETEAEARRRLEERQAALAAEEAEKRRIQAERDAALAKEEERRLAELKAEEDEKRRQQEALEDEERELLEIRERQRMLDLEGEQRMRDLEFLLREQQQVEVMEAYRIELAQLAQSTPLPLSPKALSPREDPPNLVPTHEEGPSVPSSPRVQAIIHEIEQNDEEVFLDEAKSFVQAMRLDDFDDASNLPVETLSPGAALILRQALYLEEIGADLSVVGTSANENDCHSPADERAMSSNVSESLNGPALTPFDYSHAAEDSTYDQDEHIRDTNGIAPMDESNLESAVGAPTTSEDSQLRDAMLHVDAMLFDEVKAAEEFRLKEEAKLAAEARLKYEAYVAEEARLAEEERQAEERWLLEETRRLELLEERKIMEEALRNESKFREGESLREIAFVEDERQRDIEKAALIEAAEHARIIEKQTIALKKAQEKEALIVAMEKEADEKVQAAELARMRAEIALSQASALRRESLADTIAQAEVEVLEETEAILDSYQVDPHNEQDIEQERWEFLRAEGRATLTRRMMHGWKLNDTFCRGEHCRQSPLVEKDRKVECVVCGGSGRGTDGVYAPDDTAANENFDEEDIPSTVVAPPPPPEDAVYSVNDPRFVDDFENKRHLVSQQIGRKMIEGWTLLDLSCPNCVMPLMSDGIGGQETCVLCGPIELEDDLAVRDIVDPPTDGLVDGPEVFETRNMQDAVGLQLYTVAVSDVDVQTPVALKRMENFADILKRQVSRDLEIPKSDPPESSAGYYREESPRSDPPAFFGADFEEQTKMKRLTLENVESFDAPADYTNSPPFHDKGTSRSLVDMLSLKAPDLPDGIDMDDDLMSVVIATRSEHEKNIKENPELSRRTVEVPSDDITDDLSLVTGVTGVFSAREQSAKAMARIRNSDSGKKTGGDLLPGLSAKDAGTPAPSTASTNNRLPPRPGHFSQKPPTTPDASHTKEVIALPSPARHRKAPPRPEEGATRKPLSLRSSSPKSSSSPRPSPPAKRKTLSVSLAELRDRDDDSRALSRAESKAETVVSEALDAILDRIGECKSVLVKSSDVSKQKEMAALIEQLAAAAVAVKKMEEMGVY